MKRLLAALVLVAGTALGQATNGWQEIANGWTEIQTPPSALPATAGNDGKVLTVSTGGTATEWAAAPAPGAAGSDTQVNFNDGGVLAGNAGFTFAKASKALGLTGPLTLTPGADIVPATFRAFSSGTNHIQQNQDSANNVLSGWTHAGEPFLLAGKGAGKVLTSDANGVGTWGAAGGGITNSAGANVLPKSDGTNLVASSLSDSGTAVTSTVPVLVGDGSAAAPSMAFASEPNTGFSFDIGGHIVITKVGVPHYDITFNEGLRQGPAGAISFASADPTTTGADLFLKRSAAATLQLGAVPNATPVANTLIVGESGAGTDIAGANGVIQSGAGTGSGAGSTLTFKTPDPHASDAVAQTMTTRMKIASTGITDLSSITFTGGAFLYGAGAELRSTFDVASWVTDSQSLGLGDDLWKSLYLSRATLGSKSKALVDATPTAFATIPLATGAATGGKLIYRVVATNGGTARQVVSGSINYAAVRDGATYAVDYDEIQQSTAVTSGTLSGTVTAAAASDLVTFSASFDTDLGTPVLTIYYRFDSTDTLAPTPL